MGRAIRWPGLASGARWSSITGSAFQCCPACKVNQVHHADMDVRRHIVEFVCVTYFGHVEMEEYGFVMQSKGSKAPTNDDKVICACMVELRCDSHAGGLAQA